MTGVTSVAAPSKPYRGKKISAPASSSTYPSSSPPPKKRAHKQAQKLHNKPKRFSPSTSNTLQQGASKTAQPRTPSLPNPPPTSHTHNSTKIAQTASSSSPAASTLRTPAPRATLAHIPALEYQNHRGDNHPPRRKSIRQRRRVD
ncbi:hypothetical protein HBH69_234770 [Parastagonospora nodorum]|nr:hypothetical protein HBH42_241470 [Parastagonospora nodorum]KAH5136854.1 hypothetical protein HBH69_234770 [Parastagonospora nodorum]KAH6288601.1 hypothetical protein HBI39_217560 [Parastagonospora nodorum]